MAFTLRITFSGMCLFVPEPANGTDPDRMHVLLPKSALGHGHGHEPHIPMLEFDVGHLYPGRKGGMNIIAQQRLHNGVLKLGDGTRADLAVCSEIVNLRPFVGTPIESELFNEDPKGRLISRVTLSSGRMSAVNPGACWEWEPNSYRRMAHQAQWTVPNVPDNSLEVVLRQFANDTPFGPRPVLYPFDRPDGERVLNLYVFHLPSADMGPAPRPVPRPELGTPAPHFMDYFGLWGPQIPVRLPRLRPDSDCPDTGLPSCPPLEDRGGSAYNCMLASAWAIGG